MDRQRFIAAVLCICFGCICLTPHFVYGRLQRRQRLADEELESTRKGKRVAIVGGGAAGSALAATLTSRDPLIHVTVFEPNKRSLMRTYFPLAHLGEVSFDLRTAAPDMLRGPTRWNVTREARLIEDRIEAIHPEKNEVVDSRGNVYKYDGLVLACGALPDFSGVSGVSEKDLDIGSIAYQPFTTRDRLTQVLKGTVVLAKMPAATALNRSFEGFFISLASKLHTYCIDFGKRETVRVIGVTTDTSPSDVLPTAYTEKIRNLWNRRQTEIRYQTELVSVDKNNRVVKLRNTRDGSVEDVHYELLILDPSLRAPSVIATSGLDGQHTAGFADVDKHTLQHKKYKNVFALGDCAALPTAKSYGAAFSQVPYVANNLELALKGRDLSSNSSSSSSSAGSTSCGEEVVGRYPGYSSFFMATSQTRCMWPELRYAASDAVNGPASTSTSTSASSTSSNEIKMLTRVERRFYDNAAYDGFVLSPVATVFVKSQLNAVLHFFFFMRGEWTASNWFGSPSM